MLISGLCKLQLVLNFSYLASSYIPVQSVLCIYVYISQHICCRGRRIGWCNLPTPARGDDVCSYDDSRWCLFDSPQVSDDCRGERANWCPWVWVQRHAGKSVTFHLFCSLHFMCHEHTYTHNHVNYHTHTHTNTRAHTHTHVHTYTNTHTEWGHMMWTETQTHSCAQCNLNRHTQWCRW